MAVTDDLHPAGEHDVDAYCRAVETHLCRKNDGHLLRVSGPAFDMVRGWAEQGIPLGVVRAGIDRTFERYYAKGPRRRPVHITFCEADVLDAFDGWCRALGLPLHESRVTRGDPEQAAASPSGAGLQSCPAPPHARHESLPAHLERVMQRLTRLRADAVRDTAFDRALEAAVRTIDALGSGARQARGEGRAAVLAALARIDDELLPLARERLTADRLSELERQADAELAAFRERMPPDAYGAAREAARDRLVRTAAGLPAIRYER